ncbi:TP901 family phage tail tape measure protein [Alkalihalophilus pseudofirmus OF4]|uniref:TP901 family phage tail tape measure protein n=1 Tax=Alkalihalophilus pseudofirmus (strain ATCC BAA-2126 / JCM 17055 / OF4) TaxID=398511 RepID=D3FXW3_ALKPO|nr:phage tail tape measure protein [Alkalihalophilus pseudofirmus]ADC48950.1 TP901 family phage tail tape measure protein [Alkalihalophilus pseudofirmus OF4]
MAFNLEAVLKLTDKFSKPLRSASEGVSKFSDQIEKNQKNFEKWGGALQKFGKVGSVAVTAPLTAIAGTSVKTVAAFDDSMAKVQAISGATGEQFEKMREQAMQLGSTTAHSASQVADAQSYMALAGWNANQIMEASPGLLNLASAASMDLASASDILTDQMAAFGMEAGRAGEAADMFAKTQAVANTDVHMLGEALKYAGGAAASAGMDMAQTNAVLGVLANQSLKGSQAGTTLTSMLSDMRNKAVDGMLAIGDMTLELYDAQGNMRDLGSVMGDVEKATQGMTTAQKDAALGSIFGEQAMRGVNAMLQEGSASYNKLEEAIRGSTGYAEEAAGIMEDTLGGAFRSMRSSIEGFMLVLGDQLKPYVRQAAEFIGELASKFGALDDRSQKIIIVLGILAAAIAPIALGIGIVLSMIPSMVAGFKMLAAAKAMLNVTLLASPITWVIAAIVGLIAAGYLLWKNWDTVKEKALQLWERLKDNPMLAIVAGPIGALIAAGISLYQNFDTIKERALQLWARLKDNPMLAIVAGPIGALIAAGVSLYQNFDEIRAKAAELWSGIKSNFTDIGRKTRETWDEVKTKISDSMSSATSAVSDFFSPLMSFIDTAKGKWDSFTSAITNFKMPSFSGAINLVTGGRAGNGNGHYHGLDNVRYDGYHARLHRGEMVLPREEAQAYREGRAGGGNGGGTTVTISGNTFHVRQESDIEAIAEELGKQILRHKPSLTGAF